LIDSVALRDSQQSLGEVQYWAERRLNRFEFIEDVLRRLDQQGWPNKSDIGWSDYDVEIYGNRWSNLQLTTVAEEHPPGKQLIRCRLRARWSLAATVAFWSLCGFELLVLGFAGNWLRWWVWLLLLIPVPAFFWFLRHEQRNLQSMIVVFLDEVAKEWKMIKVRPQSETGPTPANAREKTDQKSPFREPVSPKLPAPEELR